MKASIKLGGSVPQPPSGGPEPIQIPTEIPQPGIPPLPDAPPEVPQPGPAIIEPPPDEPALPIREPGTVTPARA
jgi:hypothetical protein